MRESLTPFLPDDPKVRVNNTIRSHLHSLVIPAWASLEWIFNSDSTFFRIPDVWFQQTFHQKAFFGLTGVSEEFRWLVRRKCHWISTNDLLAWNVQYFPTQTHLVWQQVSSGSVMACFDEKRDRLLTFHWLRSFYYENPNANFRH